MDYFISYNHDTAKDIVEELSKRLFEMGTSCWWLDKPLAPSTLHTAVQTAMESCHRCIVIWTTERLSHWQETEIATCRHLFWTRAPLQDPDERFVVLRLKSNREKKIPMLNGEYLDLDDVGTLALAPIVTALGPQSLVYNGRMKHEFAEHTPLSPGVHTIIGRSIDSPLEVRSPRQCWVVLTDAHGIYVQQPRPVVTHQQRWCASNVHIGDRLKEARLIACGWESHRQLTRRVVTQNWSQMPFSELAEDYELLDRRPIRP
jgi:hypothetical protein